MSTITGTVVDIQVNTPIKYANKPGTYTGYQLVYRNEANEIQTIAKAMASLRNTPSVRDALESLAPGDDFTLTQEKNDAGFLDVKSLSKGKIVTDGSAGASPQPMKEDQKDRPTTVSSSPRGVGGKVVGSTYETPEERAIRRAADAVRQKLIIRQSALNTATQYLSSDTELEELFSAAEKIEAWVMRDVTIPQ